jgi:hypothetical protein
MHIKKIKHNTIIIKSKNIFILFVEINSDSKFIISSHTLGNAHT